LFWRKGLAGLAGRHPLGIVFADDPPDELAVVGISGNDRRSAVAFRLLTNFLGSNFSDDLHN
jgi:hypothetical protein